MWLLSQALVIALGLAVASGQGANTQPSVAQNLAQLEDRLFEHSYPHEDDISRLNRLEQFVFGDYQSGSIDNRLSHLQLALTEEKQAVKEGGSPQALSSQETEAATGKGQNGQSASSFPTFDYGNYPRVSAIEKQLLGTTYMHEPLPQRIERLEMMAFGSISTSNDLGRRVDLLDQYAHRHDLFQENNKSIQTASNQQFLSSAAEDSAETVTHLNPFAPGNQMASGAAQRITIMETAVFGHSSPSHPLEERVRRLEKKLIPYDRDQASKSLPSRVDFLWKILSAANNLNTPPAAVSNSNNVLGATTPISQLSSSGNVENDVTNSTASDSQSTQSNNKRQSWLHKLSKLATSSQTTQQNNNVYQPMMNYGPLGGPGTY